uniref:hypothetical protein n=1 Tax=Treponema sp. TaxID=166 RepID=UPI00388D295A
IEQSAKSNVSLTEFILTLNKDEINYIYSFINTLHTALPDYKYEFEFLTNNSETHISKILHDSIRMKGKNPDEEFLLSQIWKHNLQPKKINNSYVYLSKKENLNIDNTEPVNYLHEEYFTTIIILLIWLGVTFLTTVYQTIVCFFDKIYISSFYKSIQVFDLLLFVLAGITGCVIFFLDIFSTQSLLKNNYQYFIFMPLHLIFAFSIFKPFKDKRLLITYWSLVSFSSLIFILIYSLINHKFPVITALLAGILVIRTLYFAFLAFISLKKIPRSIKNEG